LFFIFSTEEKLSDFNLLIIGAGSGGVACARRAASYGASVAIIEEDALGGTCVHRGCIPKKLLVYASQFSDHFEEAAGYGWSLKESSFSWKAFMGAKVEELKRLESVYEGLLDGSGVKIIRGRGRLMGVNEVIVDEKIFHAENILIATGGYPNMPEIPGIDLAIDSDDMFNLPEKPKSIIIVGGGYIACEFACIMAGLGSHVTLLYRGDMILRGFDSDVTQFVCEEMKKSGIDIRLKSSVKNIIESENSIRVITDDDVELVAEKILFATGRHPNTHDIGADKVGLKLDKDGAIEVNEGSMSSVNNIYAVGDCTNRVNLTPVAINEGRCLAETLFNNNPQLPNYINIPTAVFTQPEVGVVGLTEEEARASKFEIDIFKTDFRPLRHTLSGSESRVFMKLVVERASRRVLGCHLVGEAAGEMAQILGIAINSGATKDDFDSTMAVHPTSSEELVTMYKLGPS